MKCLTLAESSMLAVSFNLIAGDINPPPGPAGHEVPTLNFKGALSRVFCCILVKTAQVFDRKESFL